MQVRTLPARLTELALGIAPAALAASFVLGVYADTGVMLHDLVRPLFVAVGAIIVIQALVALAFRNLAIGSYLAILMVAALIDRKLLLVAIAAWAITLLARWRGSRIDLSGPLAAVIGVMLLLSVVRVSGSGAFNLGDLVTRPNGDGPVDPMAPDIFLIMLDGYPRSDTLAGFGYDNNWFEDELTERGFSVASASTSAYPFTALTVATMLNMEHLPDIASLSSPPETHVGQARALIESYNISPVLAELEQRGYWTASGSLRNVDEHLEYGEIRLWERQVLQRTSVWPWLCEHVVIPQHRAWIESMFAAVERVGAQQRDAPVFMFGHVMSPHTPIAFDAEGGPSAVRGSAGCTAQFGIDPTQIGLNQDTFEHAMAEQVHYVNTRTLDALDSLIASRPEAVVVVFSDHGARHSGEVSDEWFRSFFAARTPGREGIFGDGVRPIDIFPRLFAAYFDVTVPIADGRRYTSIHGISLPLEIAQWP